MQFELWKVRNIMERGSIDELELFFKSSALSPLSRFRYGESDVDLFGLAVVLECSAQTLKSLCAAFPTLPILSNASTAFVSNTSALHWAIQKGSRELCSVLLERLHMDLRSPILGHVAVGHIAECLVRSISELACEFPDLVSHVLLDCMLDASHMLPKHMKKGPDTLQTVAFTSEMDGGNRGNLLPLVEHRPSVPLFRTHTSPQQKHYVCAQKVMLPNFANPQVWRSSQSKDPLRELLNSKVVDAFGTPAVQLALSHRWSRVQKLIYFRLVAFLCFLMYCTGFASVVSTDTLSRSWSSLFHSNPLFYSLGIPILLLNVLFVASELIDFYFLGWVFLTNDVWGSVAMSGHLLVFVAAALHVARAASQYFVTAVAILLLWLKLVTFFHLSQDSSIVLVKLRLAFGTQIRYFLLLWAVMLVGFALSLLVVFRSGNPESINGQYENLGTSLLTVFSGSISGFSLLLKGDTSVHVEEAFKTFEDLYILQLLFFLVFSLIGGTLMMNVMIPIMGSTFEDVSPKSVAYARMEQTRVMLSAEFLMSFFRSTPVGVESPWLYGVAPINSPKWRSHESAQRKSLEADALGRLKEAEAAIVSVTQRSEALKVAIERPATTSSGRRASREA
jgi:hypothetical protein